MRILSVDLVEAQDAKEDTYLQAVKILKAAGFNAEFIRTIVFNDKDDVGYICLN